MAFIHPLRCHAPVDPKSSPLDLAFPRPQATSVDRKELIAFARHLRIIKRSVLALIQPVVEVNPFTMDPFAVQPSAVPLQMTRTLGLFDKEMILPSYDPTSLIHLDQDCLAERFQTAAETFHSVFNVPIAMVLFPAVLSIHEAQRIRLIQKQIMISEEHSMQSKRLVAVYLLLGGWVKLPTPATAADRIDKCMTLLELIYDTEEQLSQRT